MIKCGSNVKHQKNVIKSDWTTSSNFGNYYNFSNEQNRGKPTRSSKNKEIIYFGNKLDMHMSFKIDEKVGDGLEMDLLLMFFY
jgi:hypothetical protein